MWHVSDWVTNGRDYISDAIQFTWPAEDRDLWESATNMITHLTLIHEHAFGPPSHGLKT